ncbi:hypothetical protein T06_839, partial [Trichinella sp. T6]
MERFDEVECFVRSNDSRVVASMCSGKTPALKSGRRRGYEGNLEGWRGSRNTTSATDLGTRMVTRGRKKMMEASVREAVHHEEPSTSGATCGQADSYSGNAVTDRAEAKSHRSPKVINSGHPSLKASPTSPHTRRPTTSSSPRTPKLSKRGARSKIPSTPDTPSTSGGSGKQRVLVSPLLRTEKLPDLEVLQRTEEQVTVRATFPIAQAVICPLGCEKPYTAVRPDGQFAHQTRTSRSGNFSVLSNGDTKTRCLPDPPEVDGVSGVDGILDLAPRLERHGVRGLLKVVGLVMCGD